MHIFFCLMPLQSIVLAAVSEKLREYRLLLKCAVNCTNRLATDLTLKAPRVKAARSQKPLRGKSLLSTQKQLLWSTSASGAELKEVWLDSF